MCHPDHRILFPATCGEVLKALANFVAGAGGPPAETSRKHARHCLLALVPG